ncbi:hypothetical protein JI638_00790 [Listeria ivanovii subsp. londoniensis]|nr:hypothetical protein [Listeria ivanovii subsp. londoniensis]
MIKQLINGLIVTGLLVLLLAVLSLLKRKYMHKNINPLTEKKQKSRLFHFGKWIFKVISAF